MSALTRIIAANVFNPLQKLSGRLLPTARTLEASNGEVNPGGLFSLATRNVIRVHFPRPSEKKRIKRHGWKTRMSTPEGRRILMNRFLKGRFVYSH